MADARATAAGWYPDPQGTADLRWWDGTTLRFGDDALPAIGHGWASPPPAPPSSAPLPPPPALDAAG